jgi:branched-chain amino acid transport system permease protein
MWAALRRAMVAAVVAFAIALPVAGVHGDEVQGFLFTWTPPLVAAAAAFAGALLYAAARAAPSRGRGAEPPSPAVARTRSAWPWAALVVVAALPLLGLHGAWTKMLFGTMVYATIAVGLQITIGMAGLLVLGHAGFFAVGAYTFGMLTLHLHWNFWLAWPTAGAAAALTGFLVGLPALRLRGDYLAVVTLGFGEAIRWVIKNEQEWTGGDTQMPGNYVKGSFHEPQGFLGRFLWQPGTDPSRDLDHECYWLALALLVVCIVCVDLLTRSRLGRALFALREDETAARCMGIDTVRTKLVAFTSSAMWAGLAGVVFAVHEGSISPGLFDFNSSVLFVAMVVLGGLGSITGAVLGAALLNMIPLLLLDWFPDVQRYRPLAYGALLVAMMVMRPNGILGGAAARWRKAKA